METLIIIDGNSIVNRAFYGVRALSSTSGVPTNAIYGFLNIMQKYIDEYKPQYLCVAFDLKAPTFRHKMYDLYKAQRTGMPDELAVQLPYLKSILSAMNVTQLSLEGYEADDIIGTVGRICEENGISCGIVTGDKDDLQLAGENTSVLLTTTRMGQTTTQKLDANGVFEKYGVTPSEFICVKALMGDPSDNIPGVRGIGEKTAFELIKRFHTLDTLYSQLDDASIKKSVREKLTIGRDDAYLCQRLCTIDCFVPIAFTPADAAVREYDTPRLKALLDELELKKLSQRLCPAAETAPARPAPEAVKASADILTRVSANNDFYFVLNESGIEFAFDGKPYSCAPADVAAIFRNEKTRKITCEYKDARQALINLGIYARGDFYDASVAEYLIDSTRPNYTLESLCAAYDVADGVQSLGFIMNAQLKTIDERNQRSLLFDIEFPLEEVLLSMQCAGFKIDRGELGKLNDMLGERISALESGIYFMAGAPFNINSPKQLGKLLFEDLGLPVIKKTKTGYSTDSGVLEKLRSKHDIVESIIEYRHLSKLKSTYAEAFLPLLDEQDRIHSTLKQTVTATGRISSAEPNLQNIPVRTAVGREFRKIFVAPEGKLLVGADYSQIELRVLAHMSTDEKMVAAFKNNEDIHSITASQIFGTAPDFVTEQMRSRAKTVNFGIIYGQGEFSLSAELKITRREAKEYIENYFENYKGVKAFMESTVQSAAECGYVSTLFGRRRYIPELKEKNFNLRSFGERAAMNTPIQGTAADIIKIAMVKAYNALKNECPDATLILQVHDELICEVGEAHAANAADILKREMENAAKLCVPLRADVCIGKSWFETKK